MASKKKDKNNDKTAKPSLSKEQLMDLYYYMKLTRMLEERLTNLYRQNKVVGGLYRSLGQEATAVGSAYALGPDDILSPLIRDLGAIIVRGAEPKDVLCQYMAKAAGPTGGRDLNIHFGDLSKGYIGPVSMLGDMIPVMAGVALAGRLQGKNIVTLAYIGDGGISTGAFHEGLNFAAVQKLPLIVIAEYNNFAYSTPTSKQMANKDIADRGVGYGIPAEIVDGNDVVAVYELTKRAAEICRSGGGPFLIEAKTMRMKGHAEHDDFKYVPKELIAEWAAKDPISRFETYLTSSEVSTQDDLQQVNDKIAAMLDEAVDHAEQSGLPEPSTALGGVYADDNGQVEKTIQEKKHSAAFGD
ncbi:MAG TPA: thiamine pyrophosphate-dependent dehydrogenase E1 component subunit alpha [Blastocatellia bacterium]|nr:thiamine pyrophosphate-dependent dehydrogenase E1 component subunit alpha [Blastocatellia bacterium]